MKAERETQRTKFAETSGTTILGNRGDGVPPGVLVLCRSQLLEGRFVCVWILWMVFV